MEKSVLYNTFALYAQMIRHFIIRREKVKQISD